MKDIDSTIPDFPSNFYIGTNAVNFYRDNMEIKSPLERGLISDWDIVSNLLRHTFGQELQVNVKEHPVLLSEPSFNTSALREKTTELMFEDHQVPALFLAKSPVLSAFAHGRATALVLESGHGTTVAAPVYDGYVLSKSMIKSQLAGDELTKIYNHIITSMGVQIKPNFLLSKKQNADGQFTITEKKIPALSPSFHHYRVLQVVQDIKESLCKVNETALDPHTFIADSETSYSLPDHQTYTPGINNVLIPEILFNPSKFIPQSYPGYSELQYIPAIHQMITNSINNTDVDIRKDLFQNILVTGGNSLFLGFNERLNYELNTTTSPLLKLKNQSLPTTIERKYAGFIGGSILGSLGTFHQMWISKQEYEEYGRTIVDKKCP